MGADPCCCLVATISGGRIAVEIGTIRLRALGLRVDQAEGEAGLERLRVYAPDEAGLGWTRLKIEEAFGKDLVACQDVALGLHAGGLLRIEGRRPMLSTDDLALAYTPGVARVVARVGADPAAAAELTGRANTVAVVGDGSEVFGCGRISPAAALPFLEGLAATMARLGGLDALALAVERRGEGATANAIVAAAPSFGAAVLAGMSAPRGLLIAESVAERAGIPVIGEWQAMAVAAAAAVLNALRVSGTKPRAARVVIKGVNLACVVLAPLLLDLGIGDVIVLHRGRVLDWAGPGNPMHIGVLRSATNRGRIRGGLREAARSAAAIVDFDGEVIPDHVLDAMEQPRALLLLATTSAAVLDDPTGALLATRSPLGPNWVDPALVLPGLARGLLASASPITPRLLERLARTMADVAMPVGASHLLPDAFDRTLPGLLADAVRHEGPS